MWGFLRILLKAEDHNSREAHLGATEPSKINAVQLAPLLWCASEKLIIFDVRTPAEVDEYPRTIPGALLTTHVDIHNLIPWVPPEAIVILYATDDIPRTFTHLTVSSDGPKVHLLAGGLRSWYQAGLPIEALNLPESHSREKGR
jgi:rhodanese-related sulfurtransferase